MSKMDVQTCFIGLLAPRHGIRLVFPTEATGLVSRDHRVLSWQGGANLVPVWITRVRGSVKILSDSTISHITTSGYTRILSARLLVGFISLFFSFSLAHRATARLLSAVATSARLMTR